MAEGTVPAPTRTDDQLVPVKACLLIGKSNLLMDLQRKQKNPIILISLDILQNPNFFGAFTASANVPSIYIQQFWNTLIMDTKSGIYSFQLDELWFTLDVDLLCSALGITPKDPAHPFVAPYLKVPSKKPKPHVIPYCRLTKLIICYLGGRNNNHKRPQSPLHITADDYSLSNLMFVPKGGLDENYLEIAARKLRQPTAITDEESVKKKTVPPADKSDRFVDEADKEPLPAPEPPVDDNECVTRSLPVVEGKGKGIATDEQATLSLLDLPSTQPQDDTFTNVVRDTPFLADAETGADTENSNSEGDTEILNVDEERGENISNTVALEERIVELNEGQAGSDPGMDKAKITRKLSKTGKHGHEERKSTKEAGKSSQSQKVKLSVNYGSTKVKH
ncbi:hypothetical protein Tco_0706648 [Tanacetum coccineum]|uniref:Uncharacterized protein n=1 Tax=Tanacetum coccineum TaxID=301880 RepID=A0ABQ4Y9K1_9ASTR